MRELTTEEFEARLNTIPEVEPDEWDREMLSEIDAESDDSSTLLEVVRARNECSGRISVRVPKELHYSLLKDAKENGVSLNQFVMYKLAKP